MLLLFASVLFAMQVTAVTPLSASTANQHIENQQQAVADGVLTKAQSEEELKPTLLHWDEENATFHGAPIERKYYTAGSPSTWLGDRLNGEFRERGLAYNLRVSYFDAGGERSTKRIVHSGEPSDHAVSATRIVTLYDEDKLYDATGDPTGPTLSEVANDGTASFYSPDLDAEDSLYNVVEIEVVVWRM